MDVYEVEARTLPEQPTAVVRATLRVAEIGPWLATAYRDLAVGLATQGSGPAGPPFARYHRLADGRFEVEAGFPVERSVAADGAVRPSSLPAGPAAATTHVGHYDAIEPAYDALASWIGAQGGELVGDAWEVYLSDAAAEPDPATWRTEIVQPYRPT